MGFTTINLLLARIPNVHSMEIPAATRLLKCTRSADAFLTICLVYEQKGRYTRFYNSQISLLQECSQTHSVELCLF